MIFGSEYFCPTIYLLSIVECVLIATYCVGFLIYIGDGIGNHANAHIGPPTKNMGTSKVISIFYLSNYNNIPLCTSRIDITKYHDIPS